MEFDKEWCIYSICEEDIKIVADEKKLDIEGIVMDDIVYYIRKGVAWAVDDVWEHIIEEAIKQAKG